MVKHLRSGLDFSGCIIERECQGMHSALYIRMYHCLVYVFIQLYRSSYNESQ